MEEGDKNKECENCLSERTVLEDGLVGVKWMYNPHMNM